MAIADDKELNRYSISVHDFEACSGCLKELDNHKPNTILYESLLVCALIYYCRPFTGNEREKDAKATSRINIEDFSEITHEEKCFHCKCMEVRNKALAHSEWSKNPTSRSAERNVISSRPFNILTENIDSANLSALVSKLIVKCHHMRADFLCAQKQPSTAPAAEAEQAEAYPPAPANPPSESNASPKCRPA